MKTNELTGAALDWAVAKCEYDELSMKVIQHPAYAGKFPIPRPSTSWLQGGPIIEREGIGIERFDGRWLASYDLSTETSWGATGPTPLIAAMRCYVASKLGDDIDIPKELT